MASEATHATDPDQARGLYVEGQIQREKPKCGPKDLKLAAYVFDKVGGLLGSAELDQKGNYRVPVRLSRPVDVELVVGPVGQAQQVRHSSAYSRSFRAMDWEGQGEAFILRHDATLALEEWRVLLSRRICVSGHVRKVIHQEEGVDICPVPFVKVEIFDVDREACWWPWLRKWWPSVLDHRVFRIPELIKEPPIPPPPFPGPDPVPDLDPSVFETMSALPPGEAGSAPSPAAIVTPSMRVGEARSIDPTIAARLENLTLTSKLAPWHIVPHCFYSRELVCETTTDCNGYFKCCFDWWPFHFRRGRLRFDGRPDIIIKVTQVINGVPTVIYMDPYTSTRWNVTNAHIDLFLDNEEVVCGGGHCYQPPEGSPVFFTRIGDDEVYQINQTTGLYHQGALTNVAYGHTLFVYGQFGDMLTRSDPGHGDPPPYYYYRLSFARQGSSDADFKFIDVTLNDTRVDKGTLVAQSHKLGPFTVNNEPSLYEVRNFSGYYWYNPDWIGIWHSRLAEEDTGTYILRLEVFDKNGTHLTSASGTVDYRNGAGTGNGIPPSPLPPMVDHCDLVITLDNKPPVAELTVPAVTNDCGVIPWTAVPPLIFRVNAFQENNRLRQWRLWYTKGVGSEQLLAASPVSSNGLPGSYTNLPVSGAPLLAGLTSTCAFALRLRAWAHIRNGRHWIYQDQDIDAIAIEKCGP